MLDRLLHGKGRQNISCRFPVQQEAETAFKLDPWSQGGNTKLPIFRRKAGGNSADITVMCLEEGSRQTSPRGDNHNKQELESLKWDYKANSHHTIVLCTPGRIQRWAPFRMLSLQSTLTMETFFCFPLSLKFKEHT